MTGGRLLALMPADRVQYFGMPHAGATYAGRGVANYRRTSARCCVCGGEARSTHHTASRRLGVCVMETRYGDFELRPALFALCGDGASGCHGAFESHLLVARWAWDCEECERLWRTGWMLARGVRPNSADLYEFGRWVIEDRRSGSSREIKGRTG